MGNTRRKTYQSKWDDADFGREPQQHRARRRIHRSVKPLSIRDIPYGVYLKSNHWRDLRVRIIQERKNCEGCQATKNLTLHHRRYTKGGVSILWKERDSDLVLFCWDCHKAWEAHCKGFACTPDQLKTIRTLISTGLDREVAFNLFSTGRAAQRLEVVKEQNRRYTYATRLVQALMVRSYQLRL